MPSHESDTHLPLDPGWRVVLETRDRDGAPYPNIYGHIPGATREEAIDYALERFVGARAGERYLMEGWRVVAAWAVHEVDVGDVVPVEPIDQPLFRRTVR